jgi:transcriptional regulator with XRE-family HTH domain
MLKTILDEFVSDPKRHRTYEREALALQASEMILELMEKEGINRKELAVRIEASKAHVTQILSGSRNMTLHTLSDLLFALGRKANLESTPLHGSAETYAPLADRQRYLFSNPLPNPCEIIEVNGDKEFDGEEGSLPVAA